MNALGTEEHLRLLADCHSGSLRYVLLRAADEIDRLRDELESANRQMEMAEAAWLRATAGNDPKTPNS